MNNTGVEAEIASTPNTSVSTEAIQLAVRTKFTDSRDCFHWLYNYGAEPLTWSRVTIDPVINMMRALTLEENFQRHKTDVWDNWIKSPASEVQPRCKLYISPVFDRLDQTFDCISPLLPDVEVAAFKTVTKRWMGVRPDKLIVYFHDESRRSDWVTKIAPLVEGIPANPTPFTHSLSSGGFLSMALDPVSEVPASWRSETLHWMAGQIIEGQENLHAPDQIIADIYGGLAAQDIDVENWC